MNIKDFIPLISIISEEKGLAFEKAKEIVEAAIAAAYKKEYGKKSQIIRCKIDIDNRKIDFQRVKMVVDKDMIYSEKEKEEIEKHGFQREKNEENPKIFFNEEKHIMLKDAKKIDKKYKVEDEILIELEPKEKYGRIAAQSAKQVLLQKMKEAEKELVLQEYIDRKGEIVSGTVQRYENGNIIFDLGKTLGVLPKEEQIYSENYKIGERFKLYITKIETESRGHFIFLSRASPKLIEKLFELEVPEIASGQIEIKGTAREPGNRTKIAFGKKDPEIDPIGSAIGPKGARVMTVINEFRTEKIDVIRYSDDIQEYIANSLSPAKILNVKIIEEGVAEVMVPADQVSLAIGREGQNVRLASKLTGWKIDIKKVEAEVKQLDESDESDKGDEGDEKSEYEKGLAKPLKARKHKT